MGGNVFARDWWQVATIGDEATAFINDYWEMSTYAGSRIFGQDALAALAVATSCWDLGSGDARWKLERACEYRTIAD